MNHGFVLNERLRSISMMNVPVDNQHSARAMKRVCVMRCERDVAENAEAHRATSKRMVSRRSNGAKRSRIGTGQCSIDSGEHAACTRGRCRPRAFARYSVDVELSAAELRNAFDARDVSRVVNELELFRGCVSSFDLLDCIEQLGIITERAGDRAQSANVLRVIPPGVVSTAIRVGNEGDGHAACPLSNRLAPALNEKKYRAVADSGGTEADVLVENLKAVKTHDILVGVYMNWVQCVECSTLHCAHGLRRRRVDAH